MSNILIDLNNISSTNLYSTHKGGYNDYLFQYNMDKAPGSETISFGRRDSLDQWNWNHVIAITCHFLLITFLITEFHSFGFYFYSQRQRCLFYFSKYLINVTNLLNHYSVIWCLSDIQLHLCVTFYENFMMKETESEFWKSSFGGGG